VENNRQNPLPTTIYQRRTILS